MKNNLLKLLKRLSNCTIASFGELRGVGLIAFVFALSLTSCGTPDYLPKAELQTYIQDTSNGLSVAQEAGSVNMKVSYRPNEFLIWQELDGEEGAEFEEIKARYANYSYFVLQLKIGEKDALYGTSQNQADFNDKLQTLSFRMNQYVNMTTSQNDTIPVADFYYTRMFGLSKSSDILFVFNNEKINEADHVAFNIKEFGFNTGSRSFRFETKKLNQSPKLDELKHYSSEEL